MSDPKKPRRGGPITPFGMPPERQKPKPEKGAEIADDSRQDVGAALQADDSDEVIFLPEEPLEELQAMLLRPVPETAEEQTQHAETLFEMFARLGGIKEGTGTFFTSVSPNIDGRALRRAEEGLQRAIAMAEAQIREDDRAAKQYQRIRKAAGTVGRDIMIETSERTPMATTLLAMRTFWAASKAQLLAKKQAVKLKEGIPRSEEGHAELDSKTAKGAEDLFHETSGTLRKILEISGLDQMPLTDEFKATLKARESDPPQGDMAKALTSSVPPRVKHANLDRLVQQRIGDRIDRVNANASLTNMSVANTANVLDFTAELISEILEEVEKIEAEIGQILREEDGDTLEQFERVAALFHNDESAELKGAFIKLVHDGETSLGQLHTALRPIKNALATVLVNSTKDLFQRQFEASQRSTRDSRIVEETARVLGRPVDK